MSKNTTTIVKITHGEVNVSSKVVGMTGAQLRKGAGRKVSLDTLTGRVNDTTSLSQLIAKVGNEQRREMLRREANRKGGNITGATVKVEAAVAQKVTKAKDDTALKAVAQEAFDLAAAAFPHHPQLAGKRAFGLVMRGEVSTSAEAANHPKVAQAVAEYEAKKQAELANA